MTISQVSKPEEKVLPKDRLAGLKENWRTDIVSGFILFLIALPLSLGIAMASGAPPMAGIISAIVGGIFVSQTSGSFVTINGPAAGLIVVILASVERLGGGVGGYHATLAAVVISGLFLFLLGLCKAGALGKFFPATVVHGMLASIGIIIMLKQIPIMLGVAPAAKEPIELFLKLPFTFTHLNPEIALIGGASMLVLILQSASRNQTIRRIPAPIVVVLLAVGLASFFGLDHAHNYEFMGQTYVLDPKKALVSLPTNPAEGLCSPDWSHLASYGFWVSVLSITMIQGIETLLSCAAVDRLDVYKRQSNLSRDMSAVGLGSAVAGMLGGLPMIAEIVRSTANIANGARTRWSNFFHGTFMLVCMLLAASLINKIPLAALAALLVFTGFRLASPKVFRDTHAIGLEQTFLFVTTIIATLATDLLIGVFVGVAAKFLLHILHGASLPRLFKADIAQSQAHGEITLRIKQSAIFSNYLSIKHVLDRLPAGKQIIVDLHECVLIDHSVMDHLHHFGQDYAKTGGKFTIAGLEQHTASSKHPLSARRLVARPALAGVKR